VKITSDAGVLMLREVVERFDVIGPMKDDIDDEFGISTWKIGDSGLPHNLR